MSDVQAAAAAADSGAAAAAADTASTAAASTAAAASPAEPTPPGNLVAEASTPAAKTEQGAEADGAAKTGDAGDAAKKPEGDEAGKNTPVEYTDFTLPDGVVPDEQKLAEFKSLASEAGLTQEQAQKLIDTHAATLKSVNDANTQRWYDTQREWQATVMKDPEIGGKNFDDMKTTIASAIDVVGGKDAAAIRQAFDYTGAGNNPDVIRFLYRLGKSIGEGGSVDGGKPAAVEKPKSAAETLYPSQTQPNA